MALALQVDVKAATRHGIPVGNTPGVLTETTAELALALTFAAARRVVEGDKFMRAGQYKGWLPSLFVGARRSRPRPRGLLGRSFIPDDVIPASMRAGCRPSSWVRAAPAPGPAPSCLRLRMRGEYDIC